MAKAAKATAQAQEPEVQEGTDILAEGDRQKLRIQGSVFSIASPYKEGYQLKANEAAAMNQLLAENIRNNMASTIRDAKLKAHGWTDEQIKAAKAEQTGPLMEIINLSAEQVSELQAQIDEYVAGYEFGVRSGTRKDPLEREMEGIAKAILDEALRNAGKQPSKLFKENRTKYDALLNRILTENAEEIESRAKTILAQRAGISIDLGDTSDMPDNGDEAEEEQSEAAQ
jgi:hypothetical protein